MRAFHQNLSLRSAKNFVLLSLVTLGFFLPLTSLAASFSFSPASGSYSVGGDFSVRVMVNPAGQSVNAADGEITFDPALLSVTSVSKDGSAFSLWTADPTFSNTAGTIAFSGGTPSAFSNNGTVVTIRFKAKAVGTAAATFKSGSVLAADGKGTNVYTGGSPASFTITEAKKPEPAPTTPIAVAEAEEPVVEDGEGNSDITPIAVKIKSDTHPKPDIWYSTTTAQFSWRLPPDATLVRTILSDSEEATPNEDQTASTSEMVLEGVEEGIWYFFVQVKNEFGWGAVASTKIQIDTTPPLAFDFSLDESGEAPRFLFKTEDALSGVDRYEISIGNKVVSTIKAADHVDGVLVTPQDGGQVYVVVTAYDKAGNKQEVKKDLTLPKVLKPVAKTEGEGGGSTPLWIYVLLVALAMISGGLITHMMLSRRKIEHHKSLVLGEITLLRDKNDKVFTAMREEFEQMINNYDERPQLTPQERELLENMKEVLDISGELLDSGYEELKKLVNDR